MGVGAGPKITNYQGTASQRRTRWLSWRRYKLCAALKAADIGLSVEGATGVAQAAAGMILLAPDLQDVADKVEIGRRAVANTLKYLLMGASSNFGNLLDRAGRCNFTSAGRGLGFEAPSMLVLELLFSLSFILPRSSF